jgi:hypothetical protein
MAKRGRRPVDPRNPKSEQISLRLSRELLARLRRAAGKRALSEEISSRLTRSLDEEKAREHSLLWALAELLRNAEQMTGQWWATDPYTFIVARQAIFQFLERHAPPAGEMKVPDTQRAIVGLSRMPAQVQALFQPFLAPTALGGTIADSLIINLQRQAAGEQDTERYRPHAHLANLLTDPPVANASWNEGRKEDGNGP